MTEFSQADTAQVRAADLVGRVIPGVHGEIASLEAESQRRLQEIREKAIRCQARSCKPRSLNCGHLTCAIWWSVPRDTGRTASL